MTITFLHCEQCGQSFKAQRKNAKTCSAICRFRRHAAKFPGKYPEKKGAEVKNHLIQIEK